MEKPNACCGINCAACDARIATINDDNELRITTAKKWTKLYNLHHIDPELINCTGCREAGIKFYHYNNCKIRKCLRHMDFDTCEECMGMKHCETVSMVHKHLPKAIENLKSLN